MEEIVYFNIRREGGVFQASLRGGECNLLKKIYNQKTFIKYTMLDLINRAAVNISYIQPKVA